MQERISYINTSDSRELYLQKKRGGEYLHLGYLLPCLEWFVGLEEMSAIVRDWNNGKCRRKEILKTVYLLLIIGDEFRKQKPAEDVLPQR